MVSWRAHTISWILWFWSKGNWTSAQAIRNRIAYMRRYPPDYEPSPAFRTEYMVDEREAGGHPVFDVSTKSETANKTRILYIHGGAFVFEILSKHWDFIGLLAQRLEAVVTVPIIPLGPEYKLADMYAMLQPIYDDMAASRDESPLFVMGDSAGGCMSLVATQQAIKAGKRAAAGLVLITPIVDATFTNPDAHTVSQRDPWLDIVGCKEIAQLVRGDWEVDDARVSPILGDVGKLPPIMVLVAENDFLGPDAVRLVEKVRSAGRDVKLVEGPGLMHAWPLVLPNHDGKEAIDDMVSWLEGLIA